MWKYVAAAAAAIAIIVGFVIFAYDREDRAVAANALVALEEAPAGDSAALESAHAKARAQLALIRSSLARERASALVDAAYLEKRESLVEAKELTFQALALINADHESLSALRAARDHAERLAARLPSTADVTALMSQISQIYDAKRKVIEQRMAAQQELEQTRKVEAASKTREEQERARETTVWLQAERESADGGTVVASADRYCCCSRKLNTYGGDKWIRQWVTIDDCRASYRAGFETYYAGVCGETSYCGQ